LGFALSPDRRRPARRPMTARPRNPQSRPRSAGPVTRVSGADIVTVGDAGEGDGCAQAPTRSGTMGARPDGEREGANHRAVSRASASWRASRTQQGFPERARGPRRPEPGPHSPMCSQKVGTATAMSLERLPRGASAPASHQGRDPPSARHRHLVAARRTPAPPAQSRSLPRVSAPSMCRGSLGGSSVVRHRGCSQRRVILTERSEVDSESRRQPVPLSPAWHGCRGRAWPSPSGWRPDTAGPTGAGD
jgi:hypothetical protein